MPSVVVALGFGAVFAAMALAMVSLAPKRNTVAAVPSPPLTERRETEPVPAAVASREALDESEAGEAHVAITWPAMVDESAHDLSLDDRRKIVEGLGTIGDDWCAEILRRAVHEERDPRMLDALVDALQATRYE